MAIIFEYRFSFHLTYIHKMAFAWLLLGVLFSSSEAKEIELLECEPPDQPVWGGYGPIQTYYMPGDVIHYFCDVDTYIGGNFYRKCEDTGDWSGDTPVCDAATAFRTTSQTSDLDDDSGSQRAIDGIRTTCTETIGGEREEWSGTFDQPGELIRVMLFLPKGPASFEVVLVKQNGDEVICGRQTKNIDRYDWLIQDCAQHNNANAASLKIRSLTTEPLKICEIQAHVLTSPKCSDPRYPIESGRLRLTRKTATLVCDRGYTRSPEAKLECVRDGEWNRKNLYCSEKQWEVDNRETDSEPSGPDNQPNRNPERERLGSV